ncbi:SUMF1/EgtB/PvdO family nonheme iron enzyme [Erwiniaceae bacterium L1_55_4]|jgi:formylglycine-generating enzyme|nr:SUMF1/EgtB/PvdO family nonheme iron enzyme [Erwiniaceae bacterium L1_55_4]
MRNYKMIFLTLLLCACDGTNDKKTTQIQHDLVERSLANMVKVKGGTFKMGDFGPLIDEKFPISIGDDDKVLHKVTLDDFSISKYKVTWKDYDVYLHAKNLSRPDVPPGNEDDKEKLQAPDMPAALNWQQAQDYCHWLGEVSGKKIALPTEAQWEYAARDGGKYVVYATDNGKYEEGRNVPSTEQREEMTWDMFNYPVGKYPPTPLGLYDMAGNGVDWMQDWYAKDYYSHSAKKNPTGPESGTEKVLRGYESGGGAEANATVFRKSNYPTRGNRSWNLPFYNARCVMNNQ